MAEHAHTIFETATPLFPHALPGDIAESGSWVEDNRRGEKLGREALACLHTDSFIPRLGWIVEDVIRRGRFGGVETGFFEVIARAALRGS